MGKRYKGFTYYELLVAIAIMSLMVGFATITIGTVYRNNANRGADKIQSTINNARNNAMTKGTEQGYANFYYYDNKLYAYVGENVDGSTLVFSSDTRDWQVVCDNIDDVSYGFDMGGSHYSIGPWSGTLFKIGFKQSTGELVKHVDALGSDFFVDNFEIHVTKGNTDAKVFVEKYGNIYVE